MTRVNQQIKVNYWQKARDIGLSPDEMLVELYLMLCPECGASGAFRMATSTIAYHIGYPLSKIEAILKSLEQRKRIYRSDGDWILVRGKFEYETNKSDKILKCVQNEIEVSPTVFKGIFYTMYNEFFPDVEVPVAVEPIKPVPVPEPPPEPVVTNPKGVVKKKYLDTIYLTDDEYAKLEVKYGANVGRALELYDAWKTNSTRGKQIKSDYKAMLNDWIAEKLAKDKPKDIKRQQYED